MRIFVSPKDVQWVWGAHGQLTLSPVRIQDLYDEAGNAFTGYVSTLLAYPGLQVGSLRSVVRIKKLTAEIGHTLNDAYIATALAKFEAGIVPDLILMSRRSRLQLQLSRSVTIFSGGAGQPNGGTSNTAPLPIESMGIPIEVTDAIKDTESLTL